MQKNLKNLQNISKPYKDKSAFLEVPVLYGNKKISKGGSIVKKFPEE